MRNLFKIDPYKLNEEDRRFLLDKNSLEILHYEQMLMTNKMMTITIFALFTALFSLVVSSNYIENITKFIFGTLMTCLTFYLLITFYNSRNNLFKDKKRMEKESFNLFKLHFNYSRRQ